MTRRPRAKRAKRELRERVSRQAPAVPGVMRVGHEGQAMSAPDVKLGYHEPPSRNLRAFRHVLGIQHAVFLASRIEGLPLEHWMLIAVPGHASFSFSEFE